MTRGKKRNDGSRTHAGKPGDSALSAGTRAVPGEAASVGGDNHPRSSRGDGSADRRRQASPDAAGRAPAPSSPFYLKTPSSIDVENRQEIKRKIQDAIEEGYAQIEVDLADTEAISTTGLGMLVSARNHAREGGSTLILLNLRPDISFLFRLTKIDTLFDIRSV
jgi:anti-sigma B factor antagonist